MNDAFGLCGQWQVAIWLAVTLGACAGDSASTEGDRGPLGKADNFGACASDDGDVCGRKSSGSCWCDDACTRIGDCCDDKSVVCDGAVDEQGWAVGITGTQAVQITDIDLKPDGPLAVTGGFYGTATFGNATETSAGLRDAFVTRLGTASGQVAWSKRIGTPGGHDIGLRVATKDDATYLLGRIDQDADWDGVAYARGDLFVTQLDHGGNVVWTTHLGRFNPQYHLPGTSYGDCDLAVLPDGTIVIAGAYAGEVDVGNHQPLGAERGLFVARYTAAGVFQRVEVIHLDHETSSLIAPITGVHLVAAADGSVTLAASVPDSPLVIGARYVVGELFAKTRGRSDLLLARMDAAGTFVWAHVYGGPHDEHVHDLALDASGDPLVTGSWIGSLRSGETCFRHVDFKTNLGGPDYTTPYCGRRTFVATYDAATGTHTQSATLGGRNDKHYLGVSIAPLPGGDLGLLLSFNGKLAVGDATFENSAGSGSASFDLAVLHLSSAGAILTGTHLPGLFAQGDPVSNRRMVAGVSSMLHLAGTHTLDLATPSGTVISNPGAGSGGFVVRMSAP